MAQAAISFSYKHGNSFLHKCPAWVKILFVPAVSVAIFVLPPAVPLVFCFFQVILASALHFSAREQLADLKPVLYYAALLVLTKILAYTFSLFFDSEIRNTFFMIFSDEESLKSAVIAVALEEKETAFLLVKLLCVMQTASLVFKTTTSLQLREGLETMELFVRRIFHLKKKAPVADTLSLFVNFIPQVSKNWHQSQKAWRVRGGRSGLKEIIALLPVLFSVSMRQAYNAAKAISIRRSQLPPPPDCN